MSNEELYEAAEKAIQDLFNDLSVSHDKCRENMVALQGHIDNFIDALDTDDDNEEG